LGDRFVDESSRCVVPGELLQPLRNRHLVARPERHFKVDFDLWPVPRRTSFRPNARYPLQGVRTRFLGVAAMTGATHAPHHLPPDFSGAQWPNLSPFTPRGHWAAEHH